MSVIERIKLLCKENNIKQKELAKLINVDAATVCVWFAGKNNSYMIYIKEIAAIFGLTANDLLYDNTENKIADEFRKLNDYQKELVLNLINEILKK